MGVWNGQIYESFCLPVTLAAVFLKQSCGSDGFWCSGTNKR